MFRESASSAAQDHIRSGLIDCDVHNNVPSIEVLYPYLSDHWRDYLVERGVGSLEPNYYPPGAPLSARPGAVPPSGGPPGSDLGLLRGQLLDSWGVECAILNCLYGIQLVHNEYWAAAMARAVNDWQIAEWLDKEPRLRASIVVPYENAEFAAAEIDRVADHPGFVQVVLLPRTKEPLGKRRYWKIYEAAERHGLPIGIHFAGLGGNPITSSGWPSYYIEDHTVMAQAFQSQVISLVCEGIFERFPGLRVVLMEGGFAWLPSLMWRLDKHWKRLREEVPLLKRPPSEYIREHMWATTQPMEEPANPKHLVQVIEHLGSDDMLMFSTDYPHWDFDDPDRAFPVRLPPALKQKIFSENARALYGS